LLCRTRSFACHAHLLFRVSHLSFDAVHHVLGRLLPLLQVLPHLGQQRAERAHALSQRVEVAQVVLVRCLKRSHLRCECGVLLG
jgi:hypothetical protein